MGHGEYLPFVGLRLARKVDFQIATGQAMLGPSIIFPTWLAQGLTKHVSKESTFTIQAGKGNPLMLVSKGMAELCIATTPSATAAFFGKSGREPCENLRAICGLPKRDWYQFAVPASLGISSIEELAEKKCPIKLAVPPGNSPSGIHPIAHLLLSSYGINPKSIEAWGGKICIGASARPHEHVRRVVLNEADSVFEDGVVIPQWWELFARKEMKILPIKEEALAKVHEEYGNKATVIPRGWYYGRTPDRETPTIDASGYIVLVNEKMDDDLAFLLARCAVEYKAELEAEFNMLPVERSTLTYPLIPSNMAKDTGAIPLHPAAEHYYKGKSYL